MIKLIVSDIDGTLVKDGENQINPEIFDVIMELKKKNWIQNGSQTQFWLLWVQRHLALP